MVKLPVELLKYARFYCQAIEETLQPSIPEDIKNNINNIVRDVITSYESGNIHGVVQNLGNLRETIFPESGNTSIRPEALTPRFTLDFLDDELMWEWIANTKNNPDIGPDDQLAAKYVVEDLKNLVQSDGLFAKESDDI